MAWLVGNLRGWHLLNKWLVPVLWKSWIWRILLHILQIDELVHTVNIFAGCSDCAARQHGADVSTKKRRII